MTVTAYVVDVRFPQMDILGAAVARTLAPVSLALPRRTLEMIYLRRQLRFFGEYVGLNDVAAFARWLAPLHAPE
ncbi:hypothetical protein [Caballeronia sp. GAWG1-1]|uniref:hypothetical protein n=1 Tax=Caballeronia sp. GAWG1-1 TaxID=2921742 RepID=UPI002027FF90|nr:hypothetical protein [Caballeronia sp. GAWG1-1]